MTAPDLDDNAFRELLAIPVHATRAEIRRAYRQRARENHPDFFPPENKPAQELRMIALNEAYAHLLRFPGDAEAPVCERERARPAVKMAGKPKASPPAAAREFRGIPEGSRLCLL